MATRIVRIADRIERLSPYAAVALVMFVYGIGVGKYDWPPARQLKMAMDAAQDWKENWRHYLGIRSRYVEPTPRRTGGVTVYDRQRAFDGYTFVTANYEGMAQALLLDMNGEIVHRWTLDPRELWPDRIRESPAGILRDMNIHGAMMTPEGEVFLNVYALGTVKLDRCSRPVWSIARDTHHDLDVLPNGDLLIVGWEKVFETRPERPRLFPGPEGYYLDETLIRVSPEGEILEEWSLIDALYASDRQDLLFSGPGSTVASRVKDPLHNNTVEVLDAEMADAFPLFEAGDIMVSFRNINTIVVFDGRSRLVKWSTTGPFLGQHDPDFLPDGHILLYDNRITGGKALFGNTRLLEIDPVGSRIVWEWEGKGEFAFYNRSRGEQAPLPNGNILAVDSHGGRLFEVEPESGEVVWEWVNLVEPGWAGNVVDAERYPRDQVRFLDKPCPPPA